MKENKSADNNIVIDGNENIAETENKISMKLLDLLNGHKVDGIFCVAGGWAGGNVNHKGKIYVQLI